MHLPDRINSSNCTANLGAPAQNRHAVMDSERRVKVQVLVFFPFFCFRLSLYSCEFTCDDVLFPFPLIFFVFFKHCGVGVPGDFSFFRCVIFWLGKSQPGRVEE